MARWHEGEGRVLQLRLASLGHRHGEVRIELSPDELDRNVECLELRQTFGVLDVCIEELRSQLHKRGARILGEEVVTDKRTEELIEIDRKSTRLNSSH